MSEINKTNRPKFALCYTTTDRIHYVRLDPGGHLATGEQFVKVYDTREEFEADVPALFPTKRDRDNIKAQDDRTENKIER